MNENLTAVKIHQLADFLNIDPNDIQKGSNDVTFDTPKGQFAVMTKEETIAELAVIFSDQLTDLQNEVDVNKQLNQDVLKSMVSRYVSVVVEAISPTQLLDSCKDYGLIYDTDAEQFEATDYDDAKHIIRNLSDGLYQAMLNEIESHEGFLNYIANTIEVNSEYLEEIVNENSEIFLQQTGDFAVFKQKDGDTRTIERIQMEGESNAMENNERNFAYYLANEDVSIEGTTLVGDQHDFVDTLRANELLMLEQVGSTFDIAQIGTMPEFNINYLTLQLDKLIPLSKAEYENLLQLQQSVEKLQDLATLNADQYYISADVVKTITATLQSAKSAYIAALEATRQANAVEQSLEQSLSFDNIINDYKQIEFSGIWHTEALISNVPINDDMLTAIVDRTNILELAGIDRDNAIDHLEVSIAYNLTQDTVEFIVEADNPKTNEKYYKSALLELTAEETRSVKSAIEQCAANEGLTLDDYQAIAKGEMQRPKFNDKERSAAIRD